MEKFTFFYGGVFSQWYASTFVIDGITYCTAEQFMMAEKARMFGDDFALAKIMSTKYPKEQKAWGRKVRGFDADKWNAGARPVVFRGNVAKFSQNNDYRKIMMDTDGTTLVEASPKDIIWGVGLDASDPRIQDRTTWLGTNWLGEELTRVREYLKCGDCGGKDVETKFEEQDLVYGVVDKVVLKVVVPVSHCKSCGFTYTGFEAEKIRDDAVKNHLSRK